jgi:hypothetical protein
MDPGDACPACGARATRPDIVWFGEMPYHMDRIVAAIEAADLFVAIGTSGEVYPAAGFVDIAAAAGAETLEINLEPTPVPGAVRPRADGARDGGGAGLGRDRSTGEDGRRARWNRAAVSCEQAPARFQGT